MNWTDEKVKRLTELWAENWGATEIGRRLGGFTKNAVIGKSRRLGLPSRESPIKRVRAPNKPKAKSMAQPKRIPPIQGNSRFKTCQWIEGDPRFGLDDPLGHADSCKCCKPTAYGTPYCKCHAFEAYN